MNKKGSLSSMKIVELVKESWNKIGKDYYRFRDLEKMNTQLERFVSLLDAKSHVLDAGTGVGIPTAKYLTKKGLKVTGVDISESMIEEAKKNVPEANFIQKNILELDFPNESFEGVICVYTLWHIPKDLHESIYQNFHRMLRSKGVLMINTGIRESDGLSLFFGEPMLWSNNHPEQTLAQIKHLNFEILFEGVIELGGELQYWILAKKI